MARLDELVCLFCLILFEKMVASASAVKVEQVSAVKPGTILEAPHWDIQTQSLYFLDLDESRINRYDYREDRVYESEIDGYTRENLGFIVPVEGQANLFIVSVRQKLLLIHWDGQSSKATPLRIYNNIEREIGITLWCDGKVDPRGRIYGGTYRDSAFGEIFESRISGFYNVVKGRETKLLSNISVSNGLTWNVNTNQFYYIDTADFNIKEFDYNSSTGIISNPRVILEVNSNDFALDGMTIDDKGLLYVATFVGGRVLVVDPAQKKIVNEVDIPLVPQVTSVAFGGPNLDELFVTTASYDGPKPPSGGLFKILGLAKGLEMRKAVIDKDL